MSTKRIVTIAMGLALILASVAGHIWHKYFTIGALRSEHFHEYVSQHWYFWLGLTIGVVLIWARSRQPTRSPRSK
jgi:hypothetical protein